MRANLSLVLVALTAAAGASTTTTREPTTTCKPQWQWGDCEWNANGNPRWPYSNSAKSACSSFLRTTVTPCPLTKTFTSTKTATGKPVTVTKTDSFETTSTSTFSTTSDDTYTTITHTMTRSVTASAAVSVTATKTDYVSVEPILKRDTADPTAHLVPPKLDMIRHIQDRDVSTTQFCTPRTSRPTSRPPWATCCENNAGYRSACSCAGVQPRTTTLKRVTSSITVTETVTVTSTTAKTEDVTSMTTTVTTTVDVVSQVASAKAFTTTTATDTTTVTTTTTATETLPVCTSAGPFYIRVEDTNTPADGNLIRGLTGTNYLVGAGGAYEYFNPVPFSITSSGFLVASGTQYIEDDVGASEFLTYDSSSTTFPQVSCLLGAENELICTSQAGVDNSIYASSVSSSGDTYYDLRLTPNDGTVGGTLVAFCPS